MYQSETMSLSEKVEALQAKLDSYSRLNNTSTEKSVVANQTVPGDIFANI